MMSFTEVLQSYYIEIYMIYVYVYIHISYIYRYIRIDIRNHVYIHVLYVIMTCFIFLHALSFSYA